MYFINIALGRAASLLTPKLNEIKMRITVFHSAASHLFGRRFVCRRRCRCCCLVSGPVTSCPPQATVTWPNRAPPPSAGWPNNYSRSARFRNGRRRSRLFGWPRRVALPSSSSAGATSLTNGDAAEATQSSRAPPLWPNSARPAEIH